jgi:N-formylglutamate amidohydrolase
MSDVFSVVKPENPLPLIFDSPHSGRNYPADFNYACTFDDLQKCEDHFVDELYAAAPDYGAIFLKANFPRSYIDPNRAIDDVDTELLANFWTGPIINPTARSLSGIGLIRRLVKPGMPIYDRPLGSEEIENRIHTYYQPYHKEIETLFDEAHYRYGQVWHINCHSMPENTAIPRRRAIGFNGNRPKPVDFVLGDRDGTTCDPAFTRLIRHFLEDLGYSVTINDPFKGVELIRKYSEPALGRHSLQIEINKALYMDEETGLKTADFKRVKKDIDTMIGFIANHIQGMLVPLAAD